MTLQQKIDNGIKLIQAAGEMAASHRRPLEICYSGGGGDGRNFVAAGAVLQYHDREAAVAINDNDNEKS